MIQLLFGEVRVTPLGPSPVLVLREAEGTRRLAIWISANAGNAILSALEPESTDHPSTHDLLLETLATQGAIVETVTILGVADGVYSAELSVNSTVVTCRASDGVALALRSGAPIFVPDELLAEVGLSEGPVGELKDAEADAVEQFREFLANVNADDFDERDR